MPIEVVVANLPASRRERLGNRQDAFSNRASFHRAANIGENCYEFVPTQSGDDIGFVQCLPQASSHLCERTHKTPEVRFRFTMCRCPECHYPVIIAVASKPWRIILQVPAQAGTKPRPVLSLFRLHWGGVTPTSFKNVKNSLGSDYSVVRPDHLFMLMREANKLTVKSRWNWKVAAMVWQALISTVLTSRQKCLPATIAK